MKKHLLALSFFVTAHVAYSAQNTVHHAPQSSVGVYERSITLAFSLAYPLKCNDVALQMERWQQWLWTHMDPSEERTQKSAEHRALFDWYEGNCSRSYSISDL